VAVRDDWLFLVPPSRVAGYDAARELLAGPRRPTALVVGSSELSFGAIEALHDLGVSIPQDLSVVVYGDPYWGKLHTPALTVMAVSYPAMAQAAAERMVGMLVGESLGRPAEDSRTAIPIDLVVRGSTTAPQH
jgi:LacI family transcriptional regulator